MADYKTPEYVVGIVYGLLSSISKPKYRFTKPTSKNDSEYIVINAFGGTADVMQKFFVNVNYHVKDLKDKSGPSGIPDVVKLEAGSQAVLSVLKKVTTTGYLIDFEEPKIIREEALEEHFSNLRFSFKLINN
jgi:hypothetical protein